jgi:hypothetical protein
MKRMFPILVLGILGACTVAAQSSVSMQGGASAQSQTSVETSKAGWQASGTESSSTSASANEGKNSADISNGTDLTGFFVPGEFSLISPGTKKPVRSIRPVLRL